MYLPAKPLNDQNWDLLLHISPMTDARGGLESNFSALLYILTADMGHMGLGEFASNTIQKHL